MSIFCYFFVKQSSHWFIWINFCKKYDFNLTSSSYLCLYYRVFVNSRICTTCVFQLIFVFFVIFAFPVIPAKLGIWYTDLFYGFLLFFYEEAYRNKNLMLFIYI